MSRFSGQQRFLVGALVPGLLGVLLYYLVLAPLVQRYEEQRVALEEVEARLQKVQVAVAQLPQLRARHQEMATAMQQLLRTIPPQAATDELLAQVSGFASAAQARLLALSVGEISAPPKEKDRVPTGDTRVSPEQVGPAGATSQGVTSEGVTPEGQQTAQPYVQVPIDMTFLGPYGGIRQILTDLRSWGRLITVRKVEVASDDQVSPTLTARVQALCYSYTEAPAQVGGKK
ncbi:MAG TPA: type 4a pilus biogenesis protein PilO [Firmicutes bacterium]|nr:type 4a pilus biogenesis protein PilO [Bacillota bacterium]